MRGQRGARRARGVPGVRFVPLWRKRWAVVGLRWLMPLCAPDPWRDMDS